MCVCVCVCVYIASQPEPSGRDEALLCARTRASSVELLGPSDYRDFKLSLNPASLFRPQNNLTEDIFWKLPIGAGAV